MAAVAAGLGTGLLTTLLFCLPPLLDVRTVRPSAGVAQAGGIRTGRSSLVCAVVGAPAATGHRSAGRGWRSAAIAWALSDSVKVGRLVRASVHHCAGGACSSLRRLRFWSLRFMLNRVRLRLPSSLRHGLANLYRPGNQSAAVLASLGTGVMLILAVYLMQSTLLREIRETASPKLPNVFLIDVTSDEVDGVRTSFQHQPGVTQPLDLLPVVQGRFVSLNGQTLEEMKDQHFPRRMLENAELSWADTPPDGDKVTQGKWWNECQCGRNCDRRGHCAAVASGRGFRGGDRDRRTGARAESGSDLQALTDNISLPASRSCCRPANSRTSRQPGMAAYTSIQSRSPRWSEALFAAYPTVTVINIADVLDRIESVVDQITFVVRFLAGFSILAGLMILASSIASARFRRMREAVVLKTLGATRMRIVRTFSVEFSVLGLLAGSVGVVFANLLTRVLAAPAGCEPSTSIGRRQP